MSNKNLLSDQMASPSDYLPPMEKPPKPTRLPKPTDKFDGLEIETEATTHHHGEKKLKLIVKNRTLYIVPKGHGKPMKVAFNIGQLYMRGVQENMGIAIPQRKTTGNRVNRGGINKL